MGNLEDLMVWAFFDTTDQSQLTDVERAEVGAMVAKSQSRLGQLPAGRNTSVKMMRNTVANNARFTFTAPRPLVLYALLDFLVLRTATPLVMRSLGFRKKRVSAFSYWHVGSSADVGGRGGAIVFLHGIGVGPLPYYTLLRSLVASGREVFVPEQLHVSLTLQQHLCSILNRKVTASQTVASMERMLADNGHREAELVGHSYGTLPLTWFVKARPEAVRKVTLIDPISIFLHRPDVCQVLVCPPEPRQCEDPAELRREPRAGAGSYPDTQLLLE